MFVLTFSYKETAFAQVVNDAQSSSASAEFTMMPMFLPHGDTLNYRDLLIAMVKDQGYEAHCAAMQWTIDKELLGEIEKFFSDSIPPEQNFYNGLNPTVFSGIDPYIVDLTKARIPMFRGMEDKSKTIKNSSLEGMFGANYQTVANEYMLNSSGVSERLTSSYHQCIAKVQNILSIKQICNEVLGNCTIDKKYDFRIAIAEDGTSKKLFDFESSNGQIENLKFKMTDLLDWFQEIRPELQGDELYKQVCFDITGGDTSTTTTEEYTPPEVEVKKITRLREAVGRISIDLDTLYRLAFLVLVPTQDPGKENSGDKFYFLQNNPQEDKKTHAPIFIAFKIPEFATNKSKIANNIDSLQLTKLAIQPMEQNLKDIEDQNAKRAKIYELAQTQPHPVIDCPYPQCKEPLEKVLIDIINGTSLKCTNDTVRIIEATDGAEIDGTQFGVNEFQASASGIEMVFNQEDLNWEKAGDLFTPASKDLKEYLFKSESNKKAVDELKSKFSNPFEWKLVIDQNKPPLDPPMIVNAYLVLPIGETVKDVNKALSIFWNEEDFFDMIRTNVIEDMTNKDGTSKKGAIPKHYIIKNSVFGISATKQINPIDECKWEEIAKKDDSGNWYADRVKTCSRYSFGFGLSDNSSKENSSSKGELLIPDFGLGFMVRKIQQKLRNTFNQTYDYVLSCQRVEDMFLGRCKGNPKGEEKQSFCKGEAYKNIKNMPLATGVPEFAKNLFIADVAPRITDELIEAYEYAEKETGIPCEIVAGIHWTEGGLNADQSVFDGGTLRGTLKEDAKAAMLLLIDKFQGKFDKNNIEYKDLVAAIGNYNGNLNKNCDKDTRWNSKGKCPAQFSAEDHPHPLAWIDDRHSDMDLIHCLGFVEFSCNVEPTETILKELRSNLNQKQAEYGISDERKEQIINDAPQYCYANSSICQNFSEGKKYPKYQRPGSLTISVLLNEFGAAQ